MPTCPTCRKQYPDGVRSCDADGDGLLPDEAFSAADADLEQGRVVGEYRIEGRIGKGGFGTVYKAVHPLIGKAAAIKVLARQYSSNPQMVARFIAEARAVNQIRHRHIIDIFAFGSLEDGRQYFVMELLEGMTLDAYLKEHGRLSPEQAIPILRAIARALDAAHVREIAHRDLKPENVFLSMQDGEVFPKLLDFGIAKLMGESAGTSGLKTNTGTPIGTPYYMSPEQCRGKDVDHRTDVYSFGIMAHELLTGALPFQGGDIMELLVKQVSAPAPSMSSVQPALAPALDAPVLAMLEKDASRRPRSLGEAVDQLARAAREAGYDVALGPPPGDSGPRILPPISGANARALGDAETLGATPVGVQTFQGTSSSSHAPQSQRRRGLLVIIGAVAALVGAAGVVQFGRKSASVAVEAPLATMNVATAPASATVAPAPTPAPTLAAPSMVSVIVESKPPGAGVFKGEDRLATTPATLTLPAQGEKSAVVLKLDGYESAFIEIDPRNDVKLSVPLQKTITKPKGPRHRVSPPAGGPQGDIESPSWNR